MNKYELVKKLRMDTQILLGSIICTIYFGLVFLINYFKIDLIMVGVLGELITIPIILLTVTLLIYTVYLLVTKKNKLSLKLFVALVLQVLCVCFILH